MFDIRIILKTCFKIFGKKSEMFEITFSTPGNQSSNHEIETGGPTFYLEIK